MLKIVVPIVAAVSLHLMDITAITLTLDHHLLIMLQMDGDFLEIRCADDILVATRTDRIEAQGREDIPR